MKKSNPTLSTNEYLHQILIPPTVLCLPSFAYVVAFHVFGTTCCSIEKGRLLKSCSHFSAEMIVMYLKLKAISSCRSLCFLNRIHCNAVMIESEEGMEGMYDGGGLMSLLWSCWFDRFYFISFFLSMICGDEIERKKRTNENWTKERKSFAASFDIVFWHKSDVCKR